MCKSRTFLLLASSIGLGLGLAGSLLLRHCCGSKARKLSVNAPKHELPLRRLGTDARGRINKHTLLRDWWRMRWLRKDELATVAMSEHGPVKGSKVHQDDRKGSDDMRDGAIAHQKVVDENGVDGMKLTRSANYLRGFVVMDCTLDFG